MYQVHIKKGNTSEVINCESLSIANHYVIEKSYQMSLTYQIDNDGWAFAHNNKEYLPARIEIFIYHLNMEKFWQLELTSHELTIVKIAVERFVKQYANDVFTPEELQSALNTVKNPKHRAL